MKKNVLVFGTISGVIVATFMAVTMVSFSNTENPDMTNGMVVGFASMVVAFSFIFVGVKNFRDKQNQGVITFGKAFLMGFLISFIASTIYVLTWAIEFHFFLPDFATKFEALQIKTVHDQNLPPKEMQAELEKVAKSMDLYVNNPFYFTMYTYLEILPVGIIIALISAAVLRRKTKKGEPQTITQ